MWFISLLRLLKIHIVSATVQIKKVIRVGIIWQFIADPDSTENQAWQYLWDDKQFY